MRVERLTPRHFDRAREAVRTLKTAGRTGSPRPSLHRLHAYLSNRSNFLIVASENGDPVGFAVAYCLLRVDGRRMMCLYEVAVAPPWQRRGVGRAMVDVLVAWCRRNRVSKMWVITSRSNVAAARLYASTGAVASRRTDDVLFEWHWRVPPGRTGAAARGSASPPKR